MKKPPFINDQIYHIYNRGVEKRKVFLSERDYFRFTHDLYEFNDTAPAINLRYKQNQLESYNKTKVHEKLHEVQLREVEIQKPKENLIVEILAFCLMPNHYHLMLRQKVDNGIVNFMQKLGTGYTNYFNKKYERVGSLFQGRFKAVLLSEDSHFIHLPYYIHLNPLDLYAPKWRSQKLSNINSALNSLENYRWSSYLDYIGKNNFPLVTQRDFLMEFLGGPKDYKANTIKWLQEMAVDSISNLILE